VQQPDLDHVVNPNQHLRYVERLADEVLRAGFQRAQLVRRLSRNDQNGKIASRFDFLQVLHDLEAVHAGHLQIEQDQVIAVHEVQLEDLA